MRNFETNDVKGSSAAVIYNCTDPTTTSGSAAITKKRPIWNSAITAKHEDALNFWHPQAEHYAHGISNPLYVPIRNSIPLGGAPVINGIRPTYAAPGSSGHIEVYGQELQYNPVVRVGGTGVTLWLMYVSSTQLNVGYNVDAGAPIGPRWLTVETDNGTAGELFTIMNAPPSPPYVHAVVPNAAARGSSGFLEIYGDHMFNGYAVVSVSGSGVSIMNIYEGSGQINVTYTISPDATPGMRSLTVTTSAGVSNGAPFTVQ